MKIIYFILFFPCLLFAQFDVDIILQGNTNIKYDTTLIMKSIRAKLDKIQSIDEKTIVYIPIEKEFKSDDKCTFVEGFLTQYTGNSLTAEIKKSKTKFIEIDFKKKKDKIKIVTKNTDDDDIFKPKDHLKKLKDKLKKKEKTKPKKIGVLKWLKNIF